MHGIGFLGMFVALVGAALLIWAVYSSARAKREIALAQTWPEATAVVDSADVQCFHQPGSTVYSYEPKIRYRFQVGGREYWGERLRYGYFRTSTEGQARAMIAAYASGSWVPIRFNPYDPSESVVELGASPSQTLAAIMGIIVIVMGLGITMAAATGAISD